MKGAPVSRYLLEVPMRWALESRSRCSDSALEMVSVSPACQIRVLIPMKRRAYPAGDRGLLIWGVRSVFRACQICVPIPTKMEACLAGDRGRLILEMGSVLQGSQIHVLIPTKLKVYPASDRGWLTL